MHDISNGMSRDESAVCGVINCIQDLAEIGRELSEREKLERLHEVTKIEMDAIMRNAIKLAGIAADFQESD